MDISSQTEKDIAEVALIDFKALITDLRLAIRYAARVGLLKDRTVLTTLENADIAIRSSKIPNVYSLTTALSDVTAAISPVTLADLHFNRDPFLPENQKKSRIMQLALTSFSLLILLFIGYFMHSLKREQDALIAVERVQELKPQQKLTELRRIAQWDEPLALPRTSRTLNDQYHQKTNEILQINSLLVNAYTGAVLASQIPLFPFQDFFFSKKPVALGPQAPTSATNPQLKHTDAPSESATSQEASDLSNLNVKNPTGTTYLPPSTKSEITSDQSAIPSQNICAEDANGDLKLPEDSNFYPKWIKNSLMDSLDDFCFQLKVISPGGAGASLIQSMYQLEFAEAIKEKVSLRAAWFLPFLYGLLGSSVFVMRNVASIRTPSLQWFSIAMRISLGGVAGIVVGWFSSNTVTVSASNLLSLPFALAFLTGYGIDVLFTLLDRLNKALGEPSPRNV